MVEETPALDAATRAALERLADIAVPSPVPWLPQTWGWAVLAMVLLALAVWAIVRRRRQSRANRYRAHALAELAGIEARLDDGAGRIEALAAIPPLLKRVALAAWPRPEVAALSGSAWVAFLRAHSAGTAFPDAAVRLLDDVEYRPRPTLEAVTADEARAVVCMVRRWIEGHRVSA